MALVNKSEFSNFVQFTTNIPDRIFNYHRDKAETLDFQPLVPANFWTLINSTSPAMGTELEDFVNDYVKPLIIHFTMLRFMVEAGINVTQFGLVVPAEPTSQPASDTLRNQVRDQYKTDLQVYLKRFYNRLKEVSYTFDGVVYDFDCKVKQKKIMIKAV